MAAATAEVSLGDADIAALVGLARTWPDDRFSLFRKILQNVHANPNEAKYRKLKLTNARIGALWATPGVRENLLALGWVLSDGEDGEVLDLPSSADLSRTSELLSRTSEAVPAGEIVAINVLKDGKKVKLELIGSARLSALAAAIEQSDALGKVPCGRQRLLAGGAMKPLEEHRPGCATMSLTELGLQAVKLEDLWEEAVLALRAGRASFAQIAPLCACPRTLNEHRDFLLDGAKRLLKNGAAADVAHARACFARLWPREDGNRAARVAFALDCTPLATAAPGSSRLLLEVDRERLFEDTVTQVGAASAAELRCPLEVRFKGEAAEDSGGPRREFFNEFGRATAWRTTPAGTVLPPEEVARNCGRVVGLALCQAENAAQEQEQLGDGATLADLLAAVRVPSEGEEELPPQKRQRLLVGAPLSRAFIRLVQQDVPETLMELQAELNAEQSEASPDFRGSSNFFTSTLEELGLSGDLRFSVETNGQVVDLAPDGRNIVVTEATKRSWLQSVLRHELVDDRARAAAAFREGLCEAAGPAFLVLLEAAELQEEWAGQADVSDEALRLWQSVAKVNAARKAQASWFFEILQEWRDGRAQALKFTTGSDRWPVNSDGFAFSVEPMDGDDGTLPRAMTCGNMLQLPSYSSRDVLKVNLRKACEWGVSSMSLI